MLVKETEIEIVVNTTFYDNQNHNTTQLAHYAAERYELTYCLKKIQRGQQTDQNPKHSPSESCHIEDSLEEDII